LKPFAKYLLSKKNEVLICCFLPFFLIYPAEAVTTKMFKVLDTCARYRLGEINANEAIEKLKLKLTNSSTSQPKDLVKKYCSVFTPNEKIEF
jgi:hypothetical protein